MRARAPVQVQVRVWVTRAGVYKGAKAAGTAGVARASGRGAARAPPDLEEVRSARSAQSAAGLVTARGSAAARGGAGHLPGRAGGRTTTAATAAAG